MCLIIETRWLLMVMKSNEKLNQSAETSSRILSPLLAFLWAKIHVYFVASLLASTTAADRLHKAHGHIHTPTHTHTRSEILSSVKEQEVCVIRYWCNHDKFATNCALWHIKSGLETQPILCLNGTKHCNFYQTAQHQVGCRLYMPPLE